MRTQTELQKLFQDYLMKQKFENHPAELYDPMNYMISIGGKRMRAQLVLMSCEIFDCDATKSLSQAMAIELFHNFTLIHDDIMDNAPLRRGHKTVHEKYNHNAAILSGDNMLIYAYQYLLKNSGEKIHSYLVHFNDTAIRVCEGQQLDMNFEKQAIVSVEEYLQMIEMKTAVLVGCALKIGAIAAGANELDSGLIFQVGKELGIAFQLQDDILDSFGDQKLTGKQAGGDIIQNKKTLLLIEALTLADSNQKEELESWLKKKEFSPEEKVKAVLRLYNELGIRKIAEAEMLKHYQSAMSYLSKLEIKEENKLVLKNFAETLLIREY